MRRLGIAAVAVILLLAAASISFNTPRTFEAVTTAGAPLHPTFIAYSYMGSRLNPVHATTYRAAPLALARSDQSGRIAVPATFHVHRPFPIESHPSLRVELLYVPGLHNAIVRMNADDRAVVPDLADKPEQWEGTMRNVSWIIQRLMSGPDEAGLDPDRLRKRDPATAALVRELIGHFRQEFEAFLAGYRDLEREKPEMPQHVRMSSAEEQRKWTEVVEAHLAQEPRWGILIERLSGDDLKLFSRWDAKLR